MIDYKKAEQAEKLLMESGVSFTLAYNNTDKYMRCCVFGDYPTLKEFIVTTMAQAVEDMQSKYGEEVAMNSLLGMMTEVEQWYLEATKGDEKCEVLN